MWKCASTVSQAVSSGISALRKLSSSTEKPTPHLPTRGDEVEAWIKRARDRHSRAWQHNLSFHSWNTLDFLLDEYRLRADMGMGMGPMEDDDV